jgi:hypothetical protein
MPFGCLTGIFITLVAKTNDRIPLAPNKHVRMWPLNTFITVTGTEEVCGLRCNNPGTGDRPKAF